MKKWIFGLLIFLLVALGCIYLLIPGSLQITQISVLHCNPKVAYRTLSEKDKWDVWWPLGSAGSQANEDAANTRILQYRDDQYVLMEKSDNAVSISIRHAGMNASSLVRCLSLGGDSTAAVWKANINTSFNPIRRVIQYEQAFEIKKNMAAILDSFRVFIEIPANAYGMPISRSSIKDTLLVATRSMFTSYPGTKEIYDMVAKLEKYIQEQGARQTGQPMLNVTILSANAFQTMVAIPVNKVLPGNGDILYRRMVPGNFMIAQIRGGQYRVNQALDQMQLFFQDYEKTSMAIPFQSLITDRQKQPDTSQWITRIYAPVMR